PPANAFERSQFHRPLRLPLDSSDSALLLKFFPTRFEHLVARGFIAPIADQGLAEGFFVLLDAGSRNSMAPIGRYHFPFLFKFDVLRVLFRRRGVVFA